MSNMPDIFVPYFYISMNGVEFSQFYYSKVAKIEHIYSEEDSDRVVLSIVDSDLSFIENDIFTKQTPIVFKGGWEHDKSIYFSGVIGFIDVTFPEDGLVTLKITCVDNSTSLNREKEKKTWNNTNWKSVISDIGNSHGLSVKYIGDSAILSKEKSVIVKNNETDIKFLKKRLKELGYNVKVSNDKLTITQIDCVRDASKTLSYGKNDCLIKSFTPRINKETQKKETSHKVDTTGSVKSSVSTPNDGDTNGNKQGKSVTNDSSSSGYKYISGTGWEKV